MFHLHVSQSIMSSHGTLYTDNGNSWQSMADLTMKCLCLTCGSDCFQYEKYMMEAHPSQFSELCAYHDIIQSANKQTLY